MGKKGNLSINSENIFPIIKKWMYSDHDAPVFMNESVSHYVRYTEVFFSCEVYFDKKMKLKKTGRDKIDTTHFRLYYGLLDGSWKILDIQTLLDES